MSLLQTTYLTGCSLAQLFARRELTSRVHWPWDSWERISTVRVLIDTVAGGVSGLSWHKYKYSTSTSKLLMCFPQRSCVLNPGLRSNFPPSLSLFQPSRKTPLVTRISTVPATPVISSLHPSIPPPLLQPLPSSRKKKVLRKKETNNRETTRKTSTYCPPPY